MVVLPDPGSPVRTIKPGRVSTPKTSCNNASSCPDVEWKLCEFGDSAKGFCRSPKCPRTSWYMCTIQESFILRGRRRRVILGQGLASRNERRFASVIPEVSTPARHTALTEMVPVPKRRPAVHQALILRWLTC